MYNTEEKLDLDEKISGIYDERKRFFGFKNGRGFYNAVSWKKGILEGKQISIDNFVFFNEDTFLSNEEIKVLKKSKPTLICGHSHTPESLKYGLLKDENIVSFHPYYVEDADFLFHFCLCSHHNLFVQIYKAIFNRYKNETKQNIILDWNNDTPVHILLTVYGSKWWNKRIPKKS